MKIYLSGNLLRFADYDREVDVEGDTIHAGLLGLTDRYPALRTVLFDSGGQVRGVHRIFLDGGAVGPEALTASVSADADVTIFTALAGG